MDDKTQTQATTTADGETPVVEETNDPIVGDTGQATTTEPVEEVNVEDSESSEPVSDVVV